MDETNSLVIFTRASQMLAEADTIQKTKELKDLALTAADWAKRKGMGEAAIQHCRSYALEAERKMGQMLKETERANVARDNKAELRGETPPPTLAELGLSKRESSESQMLGSMPQDVFEAIKQGEKTRTSVKRELSKEKMKTMPLPSDKFKVFYADPPWIR